MKYLITFIFITSLGFSQTTPNIYAIVTNNIVSNIIVATPDVAATYSNAIATSNNAGGQACIGFIYDTTNHVFYPKSPYSSWILNTTTWQWQPPIPQPVPITGSYWIWNEANRNWISLIAPTMPMIPLVTTNNTTP